MQIQPLAVLLTVWPRLTSEWIATNLNLMLTKFKKYGREFVNIWSSCQSRMFQTAVILASSAVADLSVLDGEQLPVSNRMNCVLNNHPSINCAESVVLIQLRPHSDNYAFICYQSTGLLRQFAVQNQWHFKCKITMSAECSRNDSLLVPACKYDQIAPALQELNWLSIKHRTRLRMACLLFKRLRGWAPACSYGVWRHILAKLRNSKALADFFTSNG